MAKIDPAYREMMNAVAESLDEVFNGAARGTDRKGGFTLLVYPFGATDQGRCNYIANGASRVATRIRSRAGAQSTALRQATVSLRRRHTRRRVLASVTTAAALRLTWCVRDATAAHKGKQTNWIRQRIARICLAKLPRKNAQTEELVSFRWE